MLNNKIISICERKFIYLNYSKRTAEIYLHYIKIFLKSFPEQQIIHLNSNDFQNYLDNYKFTSSVQQNQVINAIRFLYKYGLDRKYDKVNFVRPKKEQRLPSVLSKEEISRLFKVIKNTKHKLILAIIYSAGLRVSEVINLKWSDIDKSRGVIWVRQGKGAKDRQTPLSEIVICLLLKYCGEYKITSKDKEGYVFRGQNNAEQYTAKSIQQFLKDYAKKAGINKRVHPHLIRHNYATHLYEQGTDLKFIQDTLGHKNSKTTSIYVHMSTFHISQMKTPLDSLYACRASI